MIQLKDVLSDMSTTDANGEAVPFAIEYVTYDKKRKSGGDIKSYPEAILCFKTKEKSVEQKIDIDYKKPNHSQNETRNIQILNNGKPTNVIRKINILLITKFNNQEVT